MRIPFRQLATEIVKACNKNKKTTQSVVLKTLTSYFGYHSIQAAEDQSDAPVFTPDTLAQQRATLDSLKDALFTVEQALSYTPFSPATIQAELVGIRPHELTVNDFDEFEQPIAKIILRAMSDANAGETDAFSLQHAHVDNDALGQDVYHTTLTFKAHHQTLVFVIETLESHQDHSWHYESVTDSAELDGQDIGDTFDFIAMFDADDFFKAITNGDLHVPARPDPAQVARAQALLDQHQLALHLLTR